MHISGKSKRRRKQLQRQDSTIMQQAATHLYAKGHEMHCVLTDIL